MGKLAPARVSYGDDFVISYHVYMMTGFFIIPRPTCWSWRSHLGLTKITHALLVPVYLKTNFTPKRVVVSRLHDTVVKSRTGVKFSPPCENRRYHVNKCRAMRGNWSELAPVSCKHPLSYMVSLMINSSQAQNTCMMYCTLLYGKVVVRESKHFD